MPSPAPPSADARPDAHAGPILLFDGVCSFCNRQVRFLLAHERSPSIRFASLQSAVGRAIMERVELDPDALDTVVLVDGEHVYTRSAAVLKAARTLRAPWSWLAVFRIVPRPIRDWAYDRLAASRYRIADRLEACPLPAPEHRDRFLDLGDRGDDTVVDG